MLTAAEVEIESPSSSSGEVMLADGSGNLSPDWAIPQLSELQWEQEQHFAHAIAALPRNSHERTLVTGQAYDTVCTISRSSTHSGPIFGDGPRQALYATRPGIAPPSNQSGNRPAPALRNRVR